jgi:carbon-monoxide dehydrogenase medium subunit
LIGIVILQYGIQYTDISSVGGHSAEPRRLSEGRWHPQPGKRTRSMKPPIFEYHTPRSLEEAVELLALDGAMVLAGGQSLIPAMNMRLANPTRLVDIQHISGLSDVSIQDGQIRVGAMVRHRDLELDEEVGKANPLIREVLRQVAHVPIRNRGTVVGSLCHADAAAELPMLLVLTNGSVIARGPSGTRTIGAKDFFEFHMTTTRRAGEIVVEARFPVLPNGAGYAFEEFTRRHGDYAIAAVGTIVRGSNRGLIEDISIAACGISSRPLRLEKAEALIRGGKLTSSLLAEVGKAAALSVTAGDDMHSTTDFRKHLVSVLVRRTIEKAVSRVH